MQTMKFDQKVTLHDIITENEQLCSAFVEYLASIHAMEAFEFWVEVELYKRILNEDESTKTAKFIFTTYLSPHSPTEINLEGRIRRELLENFAKNPNDPQLFNKAQDSVEMMLKYDCLRVFLEVNKGKARKSSSEPKPRKDKPESHALLQRYNSLIKLERKKVRQESFKKSISGTIRRFTTNENNNNNNNNNNIAHPMSLALNLKSSSFNLDSSKPLSDFSEMEGGRSSDCEGERERIVTRRARGKKIRMDPSRKWGVTVLDGETKGEGEEGDEAQGGDTTLETGSEKDKEKERPRSRAKTPNNSEWVASEKPANEKREKKKRSKTPSIEKALAIERERERDREKEKEKEEKEREKERPRSRAKTPSNTQWVAFEKPPIPLNETGSTECLVGGSRDKDKEKEEKETETREEKKTATEGNGGDAKTEKAWEVTPPVKKEGEKRKSGGGFFLCFGKKKNAA